MPLPVRNCCSCPTNTSPRTRPYRASGPIYIRRHARPRTLAVGEGVPPYVSMHQISLRGYSARHLMVDAEVCEGGEVATRIQRMFAVPGSRTSTCNARPGCYSCRAERALRHRCRGGYFFRV